MDAPIFIAGTPRSGTTLTARILGRHSRLFMPGELHFFEDIYSRRRELGDPRDAVSRKKILERLATLYGRFNEGTDQKKIEKLLADQRIRSELESSCGGYREILSSFMEIQARSEGKSRWGNNVPRDLFSVEDILSFYPDAKILLCIRDIRDFLISYRDKWKGTSVENSQRLRMLYHPVVTSLLWKMSARKIAALQESYPGLLLVRYEELVSRPEPTVRKICEYVGETFEPGMLDIQSSNSSAETQGQGIFASSVGRWRESLPEADVRVAQIITRKELNLLGYPVEKVRADRMKVAGELLSAPYALWRALSANREKRGPLISYAIRRARPILRRKAPGPEKTDSFFSTMLHPGSRGAGGEKIKGAQATSKLMFPEIDRAKLYILVTAVALIISYGAYALLDPHTIMFLGREDGFFEYLTALFFFIAFLVFSASYLKYRSRFLLFLSVLFFIGCGEELSWGQRLIGFDTPDIIEEKNVEGEFNLHNLEIFNSENFNNSRKEGIEKLLTINFQYKLFWLTYGVLLPVVVRKVPRIASFLRKCRVPVPPLSIGIFFLINWVIFRVLLSFILPPGEAKPFYDTAGEIMECMSALLFMLAGFYFYRNDEGGNRKGAPSPPRMAKGCEWKRSFFYSDAKVLL